ncbi:MAG: hypothetical protein KAI66_03795 [Lentisphaeria bacterium]|nr:hypothetical protein [Lentisphaeria bacterium]
MLSWFCPGGASAYLAICAGATDGKDLLRDFFGEGQQNDDSNGVDVDGKHWIELHHPRIS